MVTNPNPKAQCYCGGKYRRKNGRKSTKVAVNNAPGTHQTAPQMLKNYKHLI